MLGFDEGEEFFFDAAESFSPEKLECDRFFGYGIWSDELKSVKERRESFWMKMGFLEISSSNDEALNGSEATTQRVVECGGAVTSSYTSSMEDNLVSDCRDLNGEANCMVDESGLEWSDNISIWTEGEAAESPCSIGELDVTRMAGRVVDHKNVDVKKKKTKGWLKALMHKLKKNRSIDASEAGKESWMKVQQKKKKFMEFTAVYAGQEINGHRGLISTMKFSPDGQYIASGGEDGIVRIWSVSLTEAAACSSTSACSVEIEKTKFNSSFQKKSSSMDASVVIPEKVFQINESPLHEFHGHTSGILDLAWSTSNQILSASKDNTVRLWQVGSSKCRALFLHRNYVTSIQFNPVDENYFVSGSIDGLIRIWEVQGKRVVDWANTRDVVSAVCYQPNGKGFVAGFVSGICHFYELHGTEPLLHAEIHIGGRKKSSGNRITGIQFLDNESRRVMITSEDSKIRILDGLDVVHKYQATKSGSQRSASFTSSGQHIVSVGEDSRIYVWNYDNHHFQSSKARKSARSCEYFSPQCVSVAIPWSGTGMGTGTEKMAAFNDGDHRHKDYSLNPGARDQDRFSLASWFSIDVSCKGSVTWPEEKLPLWEVPCSEQSNRLLPSSDNDLPQQLEHKNNSQSCGNLSATWGTVIVTAGWDGKIRTFHNFGLPVKM